LCYYYLEVKITMKKLLKLFALVLFVFTISGCQANPIEEVKYSAIETALSNKESFILEVIQDGCSNCEEFIPKFKQVLEEYNLKAMSINLSTLTNEENTALQNQFNVSGTPTVIFITEGKEVSISRRIVGNTSKDKIISKLKIAGYIK